MKEIIKKIITNKNYKINWSTAIDGVPLVREGIKESVICSDKCQSRDCFNSLEKEYVCSHKLSSYNKVIGGLKVTVYGYVGDGVPGGQDKNYKKLTKGRNLKVSHVDEWFSEVSTLGGFIGERVSKMQYEVIHHFHDPVKWANQVAISSEKMLMRSEGDSFSDKFKNSSNELKAIFQASKMLVDSISMLEVYFNPESASFGNTVSSNIYKLFDKIQSIIFHAEGKKYNKKFRLNGTSHKVIHLYESFSIIALCLVQNAVKYSTESEIEISINDIDFGVEVIVKSVGPIIDEEDKKNIFRKGYRGRYASKMHHDGTGVGLYIAQEVASAHGFTIEVFSSSLSYQSGAMPIGENSFRFVVPSKGIR